ncbi:MAG: hypothetical protein KI792_04995 [Alphaproteobacteria bacterium]|nr:hypothetical protein [Alphaproteobacteria bacterium SS10]
MPDDLSRANSTNLPKPRLQALSRAMRDVARDAGLLVEQMKATGIEVFEKSDGSVVTSADRASEVLIRERLETVMEEFKDILPADTGFVGEESVEAGNVPDTSSGNFFITDPIDGTKNFVEGKRGVNWYTVNIALVLDGEPVLGVVHEPVNGDDFANTDMETPVLSLAGGPDIILRPGLETAPDGSDLPQYKTGCMSYVDVIRGVKGDYRHRLSYEWDTAAQDAILRTLGGGFYVEETGERLRNNKAADKFFNPSVIGTMKPEGPGPKAQ